MILRSKLKNGLCKIVTKSQVVTKFNVTINEDCTVLASKELRNTISGLTFNTPKPTNSTVVPA